MYKKLLAVALTYSLLLLTLNMIAQTPGQWTWMNGTNTANPLGTYGTQGVFAAGNTPPGIYEGCNWTDPNGNFWLYGGLNESLTNNYCDLWEFNPAINQWAWINGPGTPNNAPVWGTMGVPAPTNQPGSRTWGVPSWTDNNGNLWCFGGMDGTSFSIYSDLWEYNIGTNEWTWMKGPQGSGNAGVYGTLGVPNPANYPGSRYESNATWVDANNDLWMFGGLDGISFQGFSDVWKYNIITNEWTWMAGPQTTGNAGSWGTIGVASATNTPGGRTVYGSWMDNAGNFWFFGGYDMVSSYNDMWMYNPATNLFTWMSGTNNPNDPGTYGPICTSAVNYCPSSRTENRACWTRGCNKQNFETYGGTLDGSGGSSYGELWDYNCVTNKWTLMNGGYVVNPLLVYGTITVSAATNYPGGRMGQISWKDNNGYLWLFGGCNNWNVNYTNDLWRFVPDTACPSANVPPVATFTASPDTGCNPVAITFTNTSSGGTIYHWNFGDGNIDTVNANPTHTYTALGLDTVTLIVYSNGVCGIATDTIQHTVLIANPPVVNLGNDTTLCIGDSLTLDAGNPGATYLWSTTATTQTIKVGSNGNYWVNVNIGACADTDTIVVSFVAGPVIALGNDTTLCAGQPITLNAGNPGSVYLWNNGLTTQTISPTTTGQYKVTASNGNCVSVDSITITFNAVPSLNMGPNIFLCNGQDTILNALNPGDTYLWSNAAVTQTINVSTAGTYTVTITNGTCTAIDSINIQTGTAPVVNLGPDIFLCYGHDTTLYAGNPGFTYLWNTGETTQQIIANSTAAYWVTAGTPGCRGSDTVNVKVDNEIQLNMGPDTFICPGGQLELAVAKDFKEYFWLPSGGNTYYIIISQPGTYQVTVMDTNGCFQSTSHLVSEFCFADMYVPNSFTPNGDGVNDVFLAFSDSAIDFHMYIFDRWGELLFESTNIAQGWDGTYNGVKVPQDTYVYRVDYQQYDYLELQKYTKYGMVNLIR